jgi:uncharacterized protein YpmS
MGRALGFILLVVLFAGIVYAAEMPKNYDEALKLAEQYGIDEAQLNSLVEQYLDEFGCSSLESYKEQIIGAQIPDKVPYKNEIINLNISNQSFGSITIEEGIISNFSCDSSEDNTYEVSVKDYSIVLEFMEGFEMEDFLDKLESEEITVKGVGLGKRIKWFFSKLAMKWFM